MKQQDWSSITKEPAMPHGEEETQWVFPDRFTGQLETALADAPPLPGEEARYAQTRAVIEASKADASIKEAMTEGAREAEEKLVNPLFQFRNYGLQLPHHWSTISNESSFGTDHFTRVRRRMI